MKVTNIGKSRDFWFADFFLIILKSIGWYEFWLFLMCFIYVLVKVITDLKFYKRCFIKDGLQENYRLGLVDLKINGLERNLRLRLDS